MAFITLSDETTNAILNIASNNDVSVHNDYSGRFMFGDTCFGISGDPNKVEGVLADVLYETGKDGNPEFVQLYREERRRSDTYGTGIIVYFSGVVLDPDEFADWCEPYNIGE